MVRLNTNVGDDGEREYVHLFLESKCKDRLMPEALCGDVAMGDFDLNEASEAVQVLPVPAEVGRLGLESTLAYLLDEDLLCGPCLWEYQEATDNLNRKFDWSGVDGT